MATSTEYAKWIVENADKKGSEEFLKVEKAYNMSKGNVERQTSPATLTGVDESNYKEASAKNLQESLGLVDPIRSDMRVPFSVRATYKAASSPREGLKMVENMVGAENVMEGGHGRVLVRRTEGGDTFWTPIDPTGFDIGDVTTDVLGYVPETITSAITAAKAIPGPSGTALQIMGASAKAAGAGQLVGAAQDAALRYANDIPVRPMEIGARRGTQAAFEALAGTAIPLPASQLNRTAGVTGLEDNISQAIARDAVKGSETLKGMGIDAPLTAGEATGARAVQEAERMMEVMGRATSTGQKVRIRQGLVAESVRDADKVNAYGQIAVDDMAKALDNVDAAIVGKQQEAFLDAASAVQNSVTQDLASLGKGAPDITTAGGRTRASVAGVYDRAQAQAKKLYSDFDAEMAATGGNDNIVVLNSTSEFAKEIEKLTLKKRVVDGPNAGQLTSLNMEAPLLREARELVEAADTPQSIAAMRSFRSRLYESARSGENFSEGINPTTARRMAKAITKDIERSVSNYSGEGAQMLKEADTLYRTTLAPFEDTPILKKIINSRGNGGLANDADAITYFTGKAKMNELRAVGQYLDPEEYASLKRAIAEDVVVRNEIQVGGRTYADLGGALKRIENMPREMKTEVFGSEKRWRSIEMGMRQFKHLQTNKKLFMNHALPSPEALSTFVREIDELGPSVASRHVREATNAAANRQRIFGSSVASQIKKGEFGAVTRSPDKFLDDLAFSGQYSPTYVRSLLNELPPDTLEGVQSAFYRRVFSRAKDVTESTIDGMRTGRDGTYDIKKALNDVFGSEEQAQVARAVVGDKQFGQLTAWLKYELGPQKARSNVGMVGAFSREQYTSIGALPAMAAKNAAGHVIFSDSGQKLLGALGGSPKLTEGVAGAIANNFVRASRSPSARAAGMVIPGETAAAVTGEVWDAVANWNEATTGLTPDQEKAAYIFFFMPEKMIPEGEEAN